MYRYTLRPPSIEQSARWLRSLDEGWSTFRPGGTRQPRWNNETWEYEYHLETRHILTVRAQLCRQAQSFKWRHRNRDTSPPWPAQSDTLAWAGLGASDALEPLPPRVPPLDPHPSARAYTAAYSAVWESYMQEQTRELTNTERREIAVSDLQGGLGARAKIYQSLLEATESEIVRFLTEAEHVVTTSKDDKLLWADRKSLLTALGEAAAARLSINPTMGEAYLIPRKGKVVFQPGYKGLVRLAYRSGEIDSMHVDVAYEGEHYRRTGGTTPGIEHTPDDEKRTGKFEDIIGAYAVVWLKGSSRPLFRAITKATLIGAAEASGNPKNDSYSDVWRAHPEAMCFKTALIRVANMLPRSDKFRDFHLVSQRATLREVNVEPPPIAELESLHSTPALAPGKPALVAPPDCPHAADIRQARVAYAVLIDADFDRVYTAVCKACKVPAVNGAAPEPEQLTDDDGANVLARLQGAIAKAQREVIEPEILDRQPGEDDPADVEPPADWTGHGTHDRDENDDQSAGGAL